MPTVISDGTRIRTNVPALNAYDSLVRANQEIAQHQLRLSTGKRINSAADDVSGYITAKSLSARNSSLKTALRANGEALNVTAITQDAYDNITSLLSEIKDAAATASSGALGTDEKVSLAKGAYRLAQQIQFVVDSTVFGNQQLIQGEYSGSWTIGYKANNTPLNISVDLSTGNADMNVSGNNFNLNATSEAVVSRYTTITEYQTITSDNTGNTQGNGNNQGNGNAYGTTGSAGGNANGINNGNANGNANGNSGSSVSNTQTIAVQRQVGIFGGVTGLNLEDLNNVTSSDLGIFSSSQISLTITSLASALQNVSKVAAYIGGIQVRLLSQNDLLNSQIVNYNAAISRIEDADVADEQLQLVKAQFLQQTSLIMLSQANSTPSSFLSIFNQSNS